MDEESKYFDKDFITTLIDKYTWTNTRLLNLDGDTFSQDIIREVGPKIAMGLWNYGKFEFRVTVRFSRDTE